MTRYPIVRLASLAHSAKGSMAGGPFGSDLVSRDYVTSGVPVIRGTNLPKHSKFSLDNCVFVTESKADVLHLNCAHPGDLVFTQRGTLGQVGLIPNGTPYSRFLISQSQMKMVVDRSRADPLYIYHYFRLPSTVAHIENHALQAGVPHINLGILRRFEIICPPLAAQKKIAAILSAYDDLIANNQRRITLLERMAEDIYREWFVRLRFPGHESVKVEKGIPKDWRFAELSEMATINSSSIKKSAQPERILYIDISAVSTNHIDDLAEMALADAPGRARRLVKHGDVVWSSVRPANRAFCLVYEPPENLVASTGFAVISPKIGIPFTFINFAVTSDSFVEQMSMVAKGSAYPATSFDDFGKAKILQPSPDLFNRFHAICEPMFKRRHQMRLANSALAKQRDALLPRLISGKLAVDALDICFPPGMSPSD